MSIQLDKVQPKNKEQLNQLINYAFKHNIYDLNFIDTSKITDMSWLFINCEYDFDVSSWDVSNTKSISYIFYKCKNFKGKGINNWNVSKVIDMSCAFAGCKNFNCDLSNWDVSNVTYMNGVFNSCFKFKGKGLENWDVSTVNCMYGMFYNCKNFNADLSQWNVSNVIDMRAMFDGCSIFTGEGLENWNLEKIVFCYDMFYGMFCGCDKMTIPNWYKLYHKK